MRFLFHELKLQIRILGVKFGLKRLLPFHPSRVIAPSASKASAKLWHKQDTFKFSTQVKKEVEKRIFILYWQNKVIFLPVL